MPPEGEGTPLSAEEIEAVEAWIDQGADRSRRRAAPGRPAEALVVPAARPAARARSSRATRGDWVRNPIDAFLAARHEQRGLTPRPPAAPGELIRRVYLDLIGLVPTPEEVRAFVADPSDRAYEELVDRLLASPQYGERWGRHWMDVWRYSDWDGFGAEVRESQPHIWRWRDWIVESLNADQGYDRMIVEMLAADEAAPDDPAALRATGFLVRNWYKFNRNVWLDATIEHTAKAFLGLTLNCARCHDHKYDPIAQTDYYRFRAFFEPHTIRTDRVPGQPDTAKDGLVRVYDGEPEAKTFLFTRGDEKRPVQDRPLAPGVPQRARAPGAARPDHAGGPDARPPITPACSGSSGRRRWRRPDARLKAREDELAKAEKDLAAAKDPAAAEQGPQRPSSWPRRPSKRPGAGLVAVAGADRGRPWHATASLPGPTPASLARAAAKAERVADDARTPRKPCSAPSSALAEAEQAAQEPKAKKDEKLAQGGRRRQDQARPGPGRPQGEAPGAGEGRPRTTPRWAPSIRRPARAAGWPWRAGSPTARTR